MIIRYGKGRVGKVTNPGEMITYSKSGVKPGPPGSPVNTSPPVISGTTYEGSVLSCNPGAWDNGVSTFGFDWRRDGVSTGQSSNNYLVELDDAGADMTCVVTATNAIGSNVATSNTLVMDGGVVPEITAYWEKRDFLGYQGATVTAINPVIDDYATVEGASYTSPCCVQVKVSDTSTFSGATLSGGAIDLTHIEWRWKCFNSNGDVVTNFVNNGLGIKNHDTGLYENDYTDQIGPAAHFMLYSFEPDTYTIVLTGRALTAGGTSYIVATETKTITTNKEATYYKHTFVDGVNGLDTNSGKDPKGIAYTGGTYNSTTGVITAAGAWSGITYESDTLSPLNRDNYHYCESVGKAYRGEKTSDNEFTLHESERVQANSDGLASTGLNSVTTDGPQETFNNNAQDVNGEYYHLNGNAGASEYLQTLDRIGQPQSQNPCYVLAYNGDPADDYCVTIKPSGLTTTLPMHLFQYSSRQIVSHIHWDGLETQNEGLAGATLGTYPDRTGELIVDGCKSKNTRADDAWHIYSHDLFASNNGKSTVAIVGGYLDFKYVGTITYHRQGLKLNAYTTDWASVRGLELYGDCDSLQLDHYMYITSQSKMVLVTNCYGHGSTEAGPNNFLNFNPHGTDGAPPTTAGTAKLLVTANNKATENLLFGDTNSTNNVNSGQWVDKVYRVNDYSASANGFVQSSNAHVHTVINCLHDNQTAGVAVPPFLNDMVTPGETGDFYLDDNIALGGGLVFMANTYDGSSTRETASNVAARYDANDRMGWMPPTVLDASHYLQDRYYASVGSVQIYDPVAAADKTLTVFDAAVVTAGGSSVSTEGAPDWHDYSASNFLPVGFESSVPTVNIQPETTISVPDGEYMAISADFDQATSHQWYADGAPIAGETKPALTIKVVTADNGTVYTIEGTNAAGTTASAGCTLSIGATSAVHVTFDGISKSAALASSVSSGASGALAYKFKLIAFPSATAYISSAALGSNNAKCQLGISSTNTWVFDNTNLGCTVGGVTVVNGAATGLSLNTEYEVIFTINSGTCYWSTLGVGGGGGAFSNVSIYDVTFTRADTTTYIYAMDAVKLDGEAETSTGTGVSDLIYNNTVAGDWS